MYSLIRGATRAAVRAGTRPPAPPATADPPRWHGAAATAVVWAVAAVSIVLIMALMYASLRSRG